MSNIQQLLEKINYFTKTNKRIFIVAIVLLLITIYFISTSLKTTSKLSDAEAAVAGARALYIEDALKNNPKATYASSNCEFNALNEHYTLVGLLSLNDKIHDGKATDSEIQELNATVAHCH